MRLNRHCYVIGKIALQYVILKNNINMECKNYIPLHVKSLLFRPCLQDTTYKYGKLKGKT